MKSKEFETVFKQYYTVLCRFAYLFVKDEVIAEDIVMDLFVHLWENKQEHKINSFEAYLFKAIKNRAINYLKSSYYFNRQKSEELTENYQATDNIDEKIEQEELHTIIKKALEQLPERCYLVFYLKRNEGLSYKEIAQKLSISEKTVENQMNIAIRKITTYLDKH